MVKLHSTCEFRSNFLAPRWRRRADDSIMANAPSAQAMSRQPKAEQSDTFFQDLRGLLKEMVHQSLQQKPPEIPEDEYFEHLEPILNTLASECVVQQPKNLKSFAQQWVQEKHDDHKACWKQESPEIESLRQHGFLKEVLQSSEHGRKVFHAMEQRDRNGLLSLLEPVQVVQEAQKVQEFEVQKSSIQMQRGPGFSALHYLGKVLRNLRHEGITSASAAFMPHLDTHQTWRLSRSASSTLGRRSHSLSNEMRWQGKERTESRGSKLEKCGWSPSCERDGGVYLDLVTAIPSHGNCGAFDEEVIEVECPAGAIFPETTQNLNALDRNFLYFCGSSNVVVVRWLLRYSASPFAHDSNNTTAVHVACRAGSTNVLQELLKHRPSLDRADVAGWTALHVAARMSRCSIVVLLLKVGAPVASRNSHGELPSDMCLDEATHAAFSSYQDHLFSSSRSPWNFHIGPDAEDAEAPLPTPFFTPQHPIASFRGHHEASQIGIRIFNAQPGYGVAFIRAAGLVHDYPRSASKFLLQEDVDRKAVGTFLGETFAMCDTLRLAYFSRCDLWNTGVVSALLKACSCLEWPGP
eukprot:symbB.v1.2.010034.t1/scaffold650.1/size176305/13